jgi:predicted phage tail protein
MRRWLSVTWEKTQNFKSSGPLIRVLDKCKGCWKRAKRFFNAKSGGKTILVGKRAAVFGGGGILILAGVVAVLNPKEDHTIYRHTSQASEFREAPKGGAVSAALNSLFASGEKTKAAAVKKEADDKRKRVVIRYRAAQIVGDNEHGPKTIKSGSKLIGFLVNPIDTRAQSLVRVILPRGGEASGIEIERASVLLGQYSYSGDGERVYLIFSRIDSPGGGSKKISAVALDAGSFTPGIVGDEFTGGGDKIAASMGLTMFSSMTDTLTDRESLGNSFNGVQAKPTMKNGILQGLSKASQDQASRTAATIEQTRSYVVIPEGKEMIIELQEDFRN